MKTQTLSLIETILVNQQDVKYLSYIVLQDERDGGIQFTISSVGITKIRKFRTVDDCLNKITEMLSELRELEKWTMNRLKIK